MKIKYFYIVFFLLFAGCSIDFENNNSLKNENVFPNDDFEAGTQPYNVEFISDTSLTGADTFVIDKKKYSLTFCGLKGFERINAENAVLPAAYYKFSKNDFLKTRILYFFLRREKSNLLTDSEKKLNKDSGEIIVISELRGFADKNADVLKNKFESSEVFKNFNINFSRLFMKKKFMLNQYLFYPKQIENQKNKKSVSVSFIFAPVFFEHYEFLFIKENGIDEKFADAIETLMSSLQIYSQEK